MTAPVVAGTPLLALRALRSGYGDITIVHDIDLHVRAGEIVALLGANGAGKTTTLRTISGFLAPLGGEIEVLGTVLRPPGRTAKWRGRARRTGPTAIARLGVAHVPEDRGLFPGLTGREHLRLAAHRGAPGAIDEVLDLVAPLRRVVDRRAGLMSGGEQQMLAIARALVGRPRLLMVDELSLGLAPVVVQPLLALVQRLAQDVGLGVLLVEQYVASALEIADRAAVLSQGRLTYSGDATELRSDPARIAASYLGGSTRVADGG